LQTAEAIGNDLLETPFVPHHHAPYPLHIAPHSTLPAESTLARFIMWLRSPLAAVYHTALVGIDDLPRSVTSAWIQVQIARMTTGESFPVHIDTDEEGITCVYQFARDYDDDDGGQLHFSSSTRDSRPELVVPPVFGSLLLFRPKGAPHAVTPVMAPAHKPRFTVTAFYLYGNNRSEERKAVE
jgi:Rps23 Pro-64 3,4-dihydroxylase Tpa1-like proline 4-hydroxylase